MATVKNHVRPARAKTPAQLAKKAANEAAARERLARLQLDQRRQTFIAKNPEYVAQLAEITRKDREEAEALRMAVNTMRGFVIGPRLAKLAGDALATGPRFAGFCRKTNRFPTPGTAALFFALYPHERPGYVPSEAEQGENYERPGRLDSLDWQDVDAYDDREEMTIDDFRREEEYREAEYRTA